MSVRSSPVRVAVLGPVRAEVDGSAVDLGGRRQRAVLARLACAAGEVVSADRLVDDLWRGEPPPRALSALQVHISHLRRALEPDRPPRTPASVLVSEPPGYALRAELDTARVAALLEGTPTEAGLKEALAAWTGRTLAEFADEPWAAPAVVRLDELRLVATERLAELRLGGGRPADVVPELEALLREHPLREGAVRLLALALYRTGRQAEALAVIARARRRLAAELGVDPGPELRALEQDVLRHAEHVLGTPAPPVPAPVPGPAPTALVGREAELARLHAAAGRARAGATVVLVEAEAGGGKTTLVEAFRDGLAGWRTVVGRCPEVDGAPPAWAWTEVVEGLDVPPDLAARLAPLRGERREMTETFWLSRAVVELVAGAAPLLLVLDDLHRADEETLQLLRAVVGGLREAPVLVVATLRPAEIGPDLAAALAALAGPIGDRITLPGLAGPEVDALLRRHGVEPDAATVALVADRTDGNPLFVRETARLIAVEGTGAAARDVPAGVRDVLRRRVARLPAPARTVLGQAAVLGRELSVDALLRMAAADEATVLDALELGVLSGLLTEPAPGRVRFAHALVRDTLDADLPRLRRSRMHAAALAAVGTEADAATLARHVLEAGALVAPAVAFGHLDRAAREAAAAGGHREAARLWTAALPLADPARADAVRGALVSALAHSGQVAAAVAARRAAVLAARGTPALVRALTSYDAPISWTIRQDVAVDEELVALLDAELAAQEDPAERIRLLAALCFELESHDDDRTAEVTAEAMALSAALGDPRLRCLALNARSFAALGPDRRAELPGIGRELVETARRAGLTGYETEGHHLLFMVEAGRLDLDAAGAHVDAAIAMSSSGQLGQTLGWAAIFASLRLLVAGDFAAAEAGYAAVEAAMVAAGAVNAHPMGLFLRYGVRHTDGRLAEIAETYLAQVADFPPAMSDPRALALVSLGRVAEARAAWHPEVEPPRSYYWQIFMALRAEVAIALGDRAVAERVHRALTPFADEMAGLGSGTLTFGPVAHYLAELDDLLGLPAAAHRAAAAKVATRVGAAHWVR